jgi:hypothetical protein
MVRNIHTKALARFVMIGFPPNEQGSSCRQICPYQCRQPPDAARLIDREARGHPSRTHSQDNGGPENDHHEHSVGHYSEIFCLPLASGTNSNGGAAGDTRLRENYTQFCITLTNIFIIESREQGAGTVATYGTR